MTNHRLVHRSPSLAAVFRRRALAWADHQSPAFAGATARQADHL